MRRSLRSVAGLLNVGLLLPVLGAQISVSAVTRSPIRGSASTAYGLPGGYSIPANTDVSSGYVHGASSIDGWSGCSAGCSSTLTVASGSTPVVVELKESSSGSGWRLYASYSASTGRNEVVVTFRSKTLIAGRLDLSTVKHGQIDIGNDGSTELTGTDTAAADVVIGPKGLQFLLRAHSKYSGYGLGGGTVSALATLRFTPAKGNMSVVGAPCRGPVLAGFFTPSSLQHSGLLLLDASDVPTGNMALVAFGARDPKVMIPPFGCLLRTDVLIGVGVIPVNGAARLSVTIPSTVPLPKGIVRMQFLTVSGGGWVSSNGLALVLR